MFLRTNILFIPIACNPIWYLRKRETFSMFPYSYRNARETLGEREIEVGTRACLASVSMLF